jgi:hypothetical protein
MTREKFIKKWLSNKDYQYTEQNRDLMRDDLDEVINQALRQPLVSSSVCPTCNAKGYRTTLTNNSYACKKCGTWWAN